MAGKIKPYNVLPYLALSAFPEGHRNQLTLINPSYFGDINTISPQ